MVRGVRWPLLLVPSPSPARLPQDDGALLSRPDTGVWIEELVVVQNVGEDDLELRADALSNVDSLLDAEIQIPVVQAPNVAGEAAIPGVQAQNWLADLVISRDWVFKQINVETPPPPGCCSTPCRCGNSSWGWRSQYCRCQRRRFRQLRRMPVRLR